MSQILKPNLKVDLRWTLARSLEQYSRFIKSSLGDPALGGCYLKLSSHAS